MMQVFKVHENRSQALELQTEAHFQLQFSTSISARFQWVNGFSGLKSQTSNSKNFQELRPVFLCSGIDYFG